MTTVKEKTNRRSTFALLFYLNRSKIKKNGLCPVMGRISIDSYSAVFSLKTDAHPAIWDAKAGKVTGKTQSALTINKTIESYIQKVNTFYHQYLNKQGYVTAELIKNALYGIGTKKEFLLELFREHNEEFKLRIGVDRNKETHYHYILSIKHLSEFIRYKYMKEDISLRELNIAFIEAYDFYLRIDKQMSLHTLSNHLIILKKISKRAVSQGTLKRDPFISFIPEKPEKKYRHLKLEEIERIMQVHIDYDSVRHTRDMFVFAMFTGLAYVDMCNLSEKHLITEEDGCLWICIKRQKTDEESNIRLLDIPKQIIQKYWHERRGDKIFNMLSMTSVCYNLRKIEKLCDIQHVSFHMARHNFGTHITLSQGVPIETVSRMMGHSSIKTTQIYAHITNQKINEDMKILSDRITNKYNMFEDDSMPVGIKLNQNFRKRKKV